MVMDEASKKIFNMVLDGKIRETYQDLEIENIDIHNLNTIVKNVLEERSNIQINLSSEAARDKLAEEIASKILSTYNLNLKR